MNTEPTKPKSDIPWKMFLTIAISMVAISLCVMNILEIFPPEEEGKIAYTFKDGSPQYSIPYGGVGYSSTSSKRVVQITLHFYCISPEPHDAQKVMFGIATSMKKNQKIVEDYGFKLYVFDNEDDTSSLDYVQTAVNRGKKLFPNANYACLESIKWYTKTTGYGIGMGVSQLKPEGGKP